MNQSIPFIESKTHSKLPPRCVDGRKLITPIVLGPQMLGGSLHIVILRAIFENKVMNSQFILETFERLKQAGFAIGVHRGPHQNAAENMSDCGFADKLPLILEKALREQSEIIGRITQIVQNNQQIRAQLDNAYHTLHTFALNNVQIYGEYVIMTAQSVNGQIVELEGDHKEQVVYVNLKSDITLSTNEMNDQNLQAFNLDLWAVIEQAKVFFINRETILPLSFILYMATEMVLVEDKGKPALGILVHDEM